MSDLTFHDDPADVDWLELEALFKAAGLPHRSGDKLRRAFLNSSAICHAFQGDRLIGVARAISDLEYHAMVFDVAVHPEFQRRGIGRQVVLHLLAPLRVWRVMLVASSEVRSFYTGLGFAAYPDAMAKLDRSAL